MTWTAGEPFTAACLSPALVAAYDELIGPGRWTSPVGDLPRADGAVPVARTARAPGTTSRPATPGPDGQRWRANVRSRARGLLALFLLTDVGLDDAPTRLVCCSHLTVAAVPVTLRRSGHGTDADLWYPSTLCRPVAHATVTASDVFLCHPFIAHTATWPALYQSADDRQPAVSAPAGFALDGTDPSPVARAIITVWP